jgi:hypothetical protein
MQPSAKLTSNFRQNTFFPTQSKCLHNAAIQTQNSVQMLNLFPRLRTPSCPLTITRICSFANALSFVQPTSSRRMSGHCLHAEGNKCFLLTPVIIINTVHITAPHPVSSFFLSVRRKRYTIVWQCVSISFNQILSQVAYSTALISRSYAVRSIRRALPHCDRGEAERNEGIITASYSLQVEYERLKCRCMETVLLNCIVRN